MDDELDLKTLEQYVNRTAESSTRTRRVLIIMITASILGFAAYWNSHGHSWLNSRIGLLQDTFTYWEACRRETPEQKDADFYAEKVRFHETQCGPWSRPPLLKKCGDQEAQQFAQLCKRVEKYKQDRMYTKPGEVKDRIKSLVELRDEHVLMVHIPFFGVDFDVNDLGLIGGATFVILLLWFRFALYQELRNLDITFRFAEAMDMTPNRTLLRSTYQNLSMSQVLATPPKLYVAPAPRWAGPWRLKFWFEHARRVVQMLWDNASKLLYLLPLTIQIIICLHDDKTFAIAEMIAPRSAMRVFQTSHFFLYTSIFLTVNCLFIAFRTSLLWREKARRILTVRHSRGRWGRR